MIELKVPSDNHYINRLQSSKNMSVAASPTPTETISGITTSLNGDSRTSSNEYRQQSLQSAIEASSILQIANESLEEVQGGLLELKDLSESIKRTNSQENLNTLQNKANDIIAGIQDIVESTKFNGENVLTKGSEESIHNVTPYDVANELDAIGLYTLNINQQNSEETKKIIDNSVDMVNLVGNSYSVQQGHFDNNLNAIFANQSSQPQKMDIHQTQSLSSNAINDITKRAESSIQVQANVSSERSLRLLTT